jgi:hypothetical protein
VCGFPRRRSRGIAGGGERALFGAAVDFGNIERDPGINLPM